MRRPRARESKDDDPLYSSNQGRHCVTDVVVETLRRCYWAWSQHAFLLLSLMQVRSGGQNKVRPLIYDLFTIFYAMKSAPGFIQLVEQLSVLGEAHGGLPLSVDVRIAVESTR